MEYLGYKVFKRISSEHDLIIEIDKVEVKTSTTWDNILNNFTWQQIRNQDYDRIIFIGINPNDVQFYWATKEDLKQYIFGNNNFRQHAGKNGGQELYWIQGVKNLPWFRDMKDF